MKISLLGYTNKHSQQLKESGSFSLLALVRPHCENHIWFWSSQKVINILDLFQQRANKITRVLEQMTYKDSLKELASPVLRREG